MIDVSSLQAQLPSGISISNDDAHITVRTNLTYDIKRPYPILQALAVVGIAYVFAYITWHWETETNAKFWVFLAIFGMAVGYLTLLLTPNFRAADVRFTFNRTGKSCDIRSYHFNRLVYSKSVPISGDTKFNFETDATVEKTDKKSKYSMVLVVFYIKLYDGIGSSVLQSSLPNIVRQRVEDAKAQEEKQRILNTSPEGKKVTALVILLNKIVQMMSTISVGDSQPPNSPAQVAPDNPFD